MMADVARVLLISLATGFGIVLVQILAKHWCL
jgi:hypothetical protein